MKKPETIKAASESVDDKSGISSVDAGGSVSIDYSGDVTSESYVPAPQVGEEYDPRPQEDGARRTIAYLLIGLLWLVVAGLLILLGFESIKVADIKDFGVVLSPIVTLVSAATGFYYGTKSNPTGRGKK